MTQKVLVVAAHADDEALGCGGTMARLASEGHEVHVLFMADGVGARRPADGNALAERNAAAEKACRVLGVHKTHYLSLPDNKMDSLPLLEIVQPLEKVLVELRPGVIYTHHCGDLNVDHRLTHQAVMTACRPMPGANVREIYSFEVLSSTEWQTPGHMPFLPSRFVDIGDWLEKKVEALRAYEVEMRPAPHSRSIENVRHLASLRGHAMGIAAAEAFMVVRQIV